MTTIRQRCYLSTALRFCPRQGKCSALSAVLLIEKCFDRSVTVQQRRRSKQSVASVHVLTACEVLTRWNVGWAFHLLSGASIFLVIAQHPLVFTLAASLCKLMFTCFVHGLPCCTVGNNLAAETDGRSLFRRAVNVYLTARSESAKLGVQLQV